MRQHRVTTVPARAPARSPSAMQMWLWTLNHLQKATDADGNKLYHGSAPGRDVPPGRRALLAARLALPDSRRARAGSAGPRIPPLAEGLPGTVQFLTRPVPRAGGAAPPAKSAASARNWSSATTSIRRGTTEGRSTASGRANWMSREHHARHRRVARYGRHRGRRQPSAEGRPVRRLRRVRANSSACRTNWTVPERLAAGQGSRRRNRQQGHDSRSAGLSRMSRPAAVDRRQTMDVDIACVGFGPAMGGFLTTLTRLIRT